MQQNLNHIHNLLNRGKSHCWNGPNCYYLKQNRCHFYHPPNNPLQSIPQIFQMMENYPQWNLRSQQPSNNNSFEIQQSDNSHDFQSQVSLEEQIVSVNQNNQQILKNGKQWFFDHCDHFVVQENSKFEDPCSICFEEYAINQKGVKLYCNHMYHTQCIRKWLQNNVKCPLCKRDFRNHEKYGQKDPHYKTRIDSWSESEESMGESDLDYDYDISYDNSWQYDMDVESYHQPDGLDVQYYLDDDYYLE